MQIRMQLLIIDWAKEEAKMEKVIRHTHFYRIREEGGSGRLPHRSFEN